MLRTRGRIPGVVAAGHSLEGGDLLGGQGVAEALQAAVGQRPLPEARAAAELGGEALPCVAQAVGLAQRAREPLLCLPGGRLGRLGVRLRGARLALQLRTPGGGGVQGLARGALAGLGPRDLLLALADLLLHLLPRAGLRRQLALQAGALLQGALCVALCLHVLLLKALGPLLGLPHTRGDLRVLLGGLLVRLRGPLQLVAQLLLRGLQLLAPAQPRLQLRLGGLVPRPQLLVRHGELLELPALCAQQLRLAREPVPRLLGLVPARPLLLDLLADVPQLAAHGFR
mmetsp:Transcript_42052/g.132385  ORF Transcript_42052/g.132385 Transcript_42052/m.132385 type:complete len:285 (-) Transcript_42052:668-1522(-)